MEMEAAAAAMEARGTIASMLLIMLVVILFI